MSAVFATLNSLSLQEYVARWISDYMTSETGVTVMCVINLHPIILAVADEQL